MEVYFEYQIETHPTSDCEYKTVADAKKAAHEAWQEMCDAEDGYEHGRGDGYIVVMDGETGKEILLSPIILYSENNEIAR